MRGEWFKDIEEEYIAGIKQAQKEFEEAQKEFEEAKAYLEEEEAALARFRAKYPEDYEGPAPWY